MRFSGLALRYLLGALCACIPPLIALTCSDASLNTCLLVTGLSVAIAALGSATLTKRFAYSVAALERATERLAQGDLSARVYPSRTPQLARLAGGFNSMAAILKTRVEALTELGAEQDAILRSMAEGVITVSRDGRIVRMNDTARTLLEVTAVEWKGRLVQEVIHQAALQRFISTALASNQTNSEIVSLLGPSEKVLQVYSSQLSGPGTDLGVLIVLQDTTRLERLERIRTDFVANVSHELRTPITAIKGYVETLLDGAKDDPATLTKFLGVLGRQADRLQDMFTDLLTLSQLEAKGEQARADVSATDANSIIQAGLELVQNHPKRKQTTLTITSSGELTLRANTRLLQQALANLLVNAMTYSGDSPVIQVQAIGTPSQVSLVVSDDGPGIAKAHLARLFERFYRVDTGRSREMGGTGLGLAIVKHIAQVHGGSVEVSSSPGAGSVFSIHLPRR
jgi:two-component system phosphate regulon sensor histidine kinase PhoR